MTFRLSEKPEVREQEVRLAALQLAVDHYRVLGRSDGKVATIAQNFVNYVQKGELPEKERPVPAPKQQAGKPARERQAED